MLTRDDMRLLAQAQRTSNQIAVDKILPYVNEVIRHAAAAGGHTCSIDIPAFLDDVPAYEYRPVCQSIVKTLRKGKFNVTGDTLGLYDVSWLGEPSHEEDEVRIVHARKRK